MSPAPGSRHALVIATAVYRDAGLRQLRAPVHDAAELAEVLGTAAIGGFSVTTLAERSAHEIRVGIEDFLAERERDDVVVVYLSCHGIRDVRGRLYFAATDTRKDRLGSTAVDSQWLLDQLDQCRARRQLLVLDCCFSGAFAAGAKGESDGELQVHLDSHGRGRTVLTASRSSEYSFEGEPLPGVRGTGSVFTTGLVQGLRTALSVIRDPRERSEPWNDMSLTGTCAEAVRSAAALAHGYDIPIGPGTLVLGLIADPATAAARALGVGDSITHDDLLDVVREDLLGISA